MSIETTTYNEETTTLHHLAEGTVLQSGRYRITRFIDSGGFGCTYEAEQKGLGRVAIKEFFPKDFCNREISGHITVGTNSKRELVAKLKSKFVKEAKTLFSLHHPNIVHVSDVFEENDTAYYVMDYIDGRSLGKVDKLPEAKALEYIRQVCDALKYLHSQSILHLDLKPANIMIDSNDTAILIDFGVSKQYDEVAGENTSTLLGYTEGYAPLEQMNRSVREFFPSTDIYALGATLYKLLSGVTPASATCRASGEGELQPLPSGVSVKTRKAIDNAMILNKNQRTQSVEKFLADLGGKSGGGKVKNGKKSRKGLIIGVVCALVVAAAGVGVYMSNQQHQQEVAEQQRLAEEQRQREAEEQRLAEEQRQREAEEQRLAEEQRQREAEEQRLAEQRKREAEEQRLAEEQRQREAEEQRLAEQRKREEAERQRLAAQKKVGDIITINGVGAIVYKVDNSGQHGMAMSLDVKHLNWDDARKWCSNLGSGWHLPSKSELLEIFRNKEQLDKALSQSEYNGLSYWYWSSDEYESDRSCAWSMYDGNTYNFDKNGLNYVRAVSAF